MSVPSGGSRLLGRAPERGVIDGFLARARAGTSAALMLVGEPGVGKSALLEYAAGQADGFQVVQASGVESEMELAFAGLQQLCAPLLDGLARLPGPQRAALETAFGLASEAGSAEGGGQARVPPDPFFVGLGALGLLSEAAAERPLLCVVDDVQWLDRASVRALGLAARRLGAEPVAMLLASREPAGQAGLPGLDELPVAGLAGADARALLATVLPGWVTGKVADRIIAETAGNPLALLELPRGMTPVERAGGLGLLDAARTGGWACRPARRRCWRRAAQPRISTGRRSSGWAGPR
jgi:hypothetical protein